MTSPPAGTQQPEPKHCDHEKVCMFLLDFERKSGCPQTCDHDTRVRGPVPTEQPTPCPHLKCVCKAECEHQTKDGGCSLQKDHDAIIAAQSTAAERSRLTQGRKVITLCGSVKFWDEYIHQNAVLTLQGNIVLSCGLSLKEGYEDILVDLPIDDVKKDLDFLHLRKIDLSDEIFVLNVGGYIGDSTKREIEYALSNGKKVKYLESLRAQPEPKEQDPE